jgi:hypothetical protein
VKSQNPVGPAGTGGATPTGPSLAFFSGYAPLQDPLRLELVLLFTDGLPNCNGSIPPESCVCTGAADSCSGQLQPRVPRQGPDGAGGAGPRRAWGARGGHWIWRRDAGQPRRWGAGAHRASGDGAGRELPAAVSGATAGSGLRPAQPLSGRGVPPAVLPGAGQPRARGGPGGDHREPRPGAVSPGNHSRADLRGPHPPHPERHEVPAGDDTWHYVPPGDGGPAIRFLGPLCTAIEGSTAQNPVQLDLRILRVL